MLKLNITMDESELKRRLDTIEESSKRLLKAADGESMRIQQVISSSKQSLFEIYDPRKCSWVIFPSEMILDEFPVTLLNEVFMITTKQGVRIMRPGVCYRIKGVIFKLSLLEPVD
jgi:hypothetical protein